MAGTLAADPPARPSRETNRRHRHKCAASRSERVAAPIASRQHCQSASQMHHRDFWQLSAGSVPVRWPAIPFQRRPSAAIQAACRITVSDTLLDAHTLRWCHPRRLAADQRATAVETNQRNPRQLPAADRLTSAFLCFCGPAQRGDPQLQVSVFLRISRSDFLQTQKYRDPDRQRLESLRPSSGWHWPAAPSHHRQTLSDPLQAALSLPYSAPLPIPAAGCGSASLRCTATPPADCHPRRSNQPHLSTADHPPDQRTSTLPQNAVDGSVSASFKCPVRRGRRPRVHDPCGPLRAGSGCCMPATPTAVALGARSNEHEITRPED